MNAENNEGADPDGQGGLGRGAGGSGQGRGCQERGMPNLDVSTEILCVSVVLAVLNFCCVMSSSNW